MVVPIVTSEPAPARADRSDVQPERFGRVTIREADADEECLALAPIGLTIGRTPTPPDRHGVNRWKISSPIARSA